MRSLLLALVAGAFACGGPSGGADPCTTALRDGPPTADIECPAGSERQTRFERSRRGIPTATGRRTSTSDISETRWCTDGTGREQGPYIALDARGQVRRSGSHRDGTPAGTWVAWTERGAPQAVTTYVNGEVDGERLCGSPALVWR